MDAETRLTRVEYKFCRRMDPQVAILRNPLRGERDIKPDTNNKTPPLVGGEKAEPNVSA